MKIFGLGSKVDKTPSEASSKTRSRYLFASTASLERALDGTDKAYEQYYFALYHCSPNEPAGINQYREQLRQSYPKKTVAIGSHFVLWGEPAFQALTWYYEQLFSCSTLPEDFRAYASRRLGEITDKHQKSQGLPASIDLSEGQLSEDPALTFYACLALDNRQIVSTSGEPL